MCEIYFRVNQKFYDAAKMNAEKISNEKNTFFHGSKVPINTIMASGSIFLL
jgi:hypothetical protein